MAEIKAHDMLIACARVFAGALLQGDGARPSKASTERDLERAARIYGLACTNLTKARKKQAAAKKSQSK